MRQRAGRREGGGRGQGEGRVGACAPRLLVSADGFVFPPSSSFPPPPGITGAPPESGLGLTGAAPVPVTMEPGKGAPPLPRELQGLAAPRPSLPPGATAPCRRRARWAWRKRRGGVSRYAVCAQSSMGNVVRWLLPNYESRRAPRPERISGGRRRAGP